jgi:hypothetical protein
MTPIKNFSLRPDPVSIPFPRVLMEMIDGNRPEPIMNYGSLAEREK